MRNTLFLVRRQTKINLQLHDLRSGFIFAPLLIILPIDLFLSIIQLYTLELQWKTRFCDTKSIQNHNDVSQSIRIQSTWLIVHQKVQTLYFTIMEMLGSKSGDEILYKLVPQQCHFLKNIKIAIFQFKNLKVR